MASVGAAHHVSEGHKNNITSDTNQELLEPCLGIIHILEGCEVVDEADAEAKLEALVVRCATWYDFTLEDQADDFFPITLKRLFDGVCEKWIQKKGWLRCVRDTEHEGGGRATEGRDATCSTCSEEDDGEYARPGLLLNVLQLLRLFTRDPRYRTSWNLAAEDRPLPQAEVAGPFRGAVARAGGPRERLRCDPAGEGDAGGVRFHSEAAGHRRG